ncbi:MAG: hypothetical protein PHD76_06840 [Methylacidiphilales bacterium]|nr:hypothetical protein [Candidatus Methylacidiphilales bacterium]
MILWVDLPTILTLAGLEVVLSADNAVVLAALAQTLRPDLQKRALFYGLLGAFILRFLAILCAKWIIQFWFLQVAGGAYLIWLAAAHIMGPAKKKGEPKAGNFGFWGVVVAIELTDMAFAADSVLAAVGMSTKLWVIYIGAMSGLIAMRFAAVVILGLLKRFPALVVYAYVLVAWIGLKLVFQGCAGRLWNSALHFSTEQFWFVMGLIMLAALVHGLRAWHHGKRSI